MAYGYKDIGPHWLRYFLAALRHQAIAWANLDIKGLEYFDVVDLTISDALKCKEHTSKGSQTTLKMIGAREYFNQIEEGWPKYEIMTFIYS